ncbi:MAG: CBS domain-containing protein [Candidatus Omnitrophica bacterium]|nr:CBS domain-containing protein [Candidatus Omnitrophota bacterium]
MAPPKTIEAILKETKIYQILRPKCVNAPQDISLKEALDLMHKEKSGYIVVRDEHLRVAGTFTERDVLMKVLRKGVSLDEPMKKYMNTETIVLSKMDTIGAAINAMREYNVRHIPLVDETNQMTGVLSVRTIVTFLAELLSVEIFNLPPKADQVFETVEGG